MKKGKLKQFMHINNCNTGEVESSHVASYYLKVSAEWQLKPFSTLKVYNQKTDEY